MIGGAQKINSILSFPSFFFFDWSSSSFGAYRIVWLFFGEENKNAIL